MAAPEPDCHPGYVGGGIKRRREHADGDVYSADDPSEPALHLHQPFSTSCRRSRAPTARALGFWVSCQLLMLLLCESRAESFGTSLLTFRGPL